MAHELTTNQQGQVEFAYLEQDGLPWHGLGQPMPVGASIESAADEPELKEVYETERHLLYVACTRARDHLLVTSSDSPSEFLSDLQANAG